jgi:hypothetical protein
VGVIRAFDAAVLEFGVVTENDSLHSESAYRCAEKAYRCALSLLYIDTSREWMAEADQWFEQYRAAMMALLPRAGKSAAGYTDGLAQAGSGRA